MGARAVDFANENIAGVTVSVKKYPNGVPAQYPIEIAFRDQTHKYLEIWLKRL